MSKKTYSVAVFAGDGIGHEITPPALDILNMACARAATMSGTGVTAASLQFTPLQAGAQAYKSSGTALSDKTVERARQADAILLACMGDPAIRYPDGTEVVAQIELRFRLGLYAGLRPVRTIPGVPVPLADPRMKDVDFVLVRESIEGLFAPTHPGTRDARQATETLLITRDNSEKLFKLVFELAEHRKTLGHKGRVTCIDKANVFVAFAFFRDIFHEIAASYPSLSSDHAYVDAMAMHLVNQPWDYDVMVTENMFGDILSDLGAALMGGMGYAPSADIGDKHAVFQPCHGTAPDIVGQGIANPTAMFLSAAMMLDWMGRTRQDELLGEAGRLIVDAVDKAFAPGNLRTCELGGEAGIDAVTTAVKQALEKS